MRTRSGPVASQSSASRARCASRAAATRLGRGGEGGLRRIADGLEVDAAVGLDGRIEQGEVALDRGRHRRPIPLPERGAALDIGEEEGDGAAGETSAKTPLRTFQQYAANGNRTRAYGTTRIMCYRQRSTAPSPIQMRWCVRGCP